MNATLNKKREEPQKLKQGGEKREKEESDRWISDEKVMIAMVEVISMSAEFFLFGIFHCKSVQGRPLRVHN